MKRKYVKIKLGRNELNIRTAIVLNVEAKTEAELETLVLCCDYMSGAASCWWPYISELSKHFRLVMPDLGTYGANTRISDCEEYNMAGDPAERLILDWWKFWVEAMGKDLPAKFNICGIGNGGFQAGLFAADAPDKISRLLMISPARFCPPPNDEFDPYEVEMNLS